MTLLSIIVCLILGRQILLILTNDIKSFLMRLVLSFGLGTGFLSLFMFLWGLFNIPYIYFPWLITILVLIGTFIMTLKGYRPIKINYQKIRQTIKRLKILEWFLICLILFQLLFVFFQATQRPVVQMDAATNWAFKAKTIFLKQDIFQKDSPWFLGAGAHPSYPMHVPLLLSWSYFWMGEVNDAMVGVWFFIYFLALIVFLYYFLRKILKIEYTLGFVAIFSTIPLFVYHGFANYADIVLSFYVSLSAGLIYYYLKTNNKSYLLLSAIFSGFCIWTKNEGLMLSILLIISLLIIKFYKEKGLFKNIKIKRILYFLLPPVLISAPWLIFKTINNLGFNNLEKPLILEGPHFNVLPLMFHQIFMPSSFHIWFFVFIISLIFIFKKKNIKSENLFLTILFLIVFLAYIFIYILTHSYIFVMDGTI